MTTLTAALAARIVERTMAVVARNVNVMDERGVILASGQPDRVHTRHEGALLAAEQDRTVVIDDVHELLLRGVQPGVNLPLHHRGAVVGVVGISGPPQEVEVLGDLIRVTAELMVEQAAALEVGRWRERRREDFLVAAAGGLLDEDATTEMAETLGWDLALPRRCTVLRPTGEAHVDLLALQRRVAGLLPEQAGAARVGAVGDQELAVWWPAGPSPVAALGALPGTAVVTGEEHSGGEGVHRAFVSAHESLRVTTLPGGGYDPQDLALLALLVGLRGDWRGAGVAAPWRRLVEQDRHGELQRTVRSWLAHDLDVARCAADLHVHRNTLRLRLSRVETITGLDVRRVPSLLQLYLGPLLDEGPVSS
ncbi:hypothetical protein EEW87_004770 [Janibacter melonis]|uniref:CdaR family transcriptional regulator n=1 Tax=Janibacter melonis TaxID=262209 RepID=A0A5P8FL51_9MICO|nr:sugar diacid recognition domain-containing protein [Janibacter melonis]MCM3554105.1 helix-turn-helix domain-containing protein [Janibacter melonis]QFQ29790.2 hypothetical protein EEW87_004770 [Janibacter melonis]